MKVSSVHGAAAGSKPLKTAAEAVQRFGGSPMPDSLVEESRETREQLLRELGGLDGLCTKLEDMDREREQRQAARKSSPRGERSAKRRGPGRRRSPRFATEEEGMAAVSLDRKHIGG